jgi:hypothetical protein
MREWEKYIKSEEYENSFRWAAHNEHRKGSMWGAFMAGFLAANPDGTKSDSANTNLSGGCSEPSRSKDLLAERETNEG